MLFEEWYRGYYATLFAALVVVAGDRDAAHDAADEAFVRALERWERVSRMSSPEGWTYTVGVNLLRGRGGRRAVERGPVTDVSCPDLHPEVWESVRRLSPRQREAIALRYILDLSEADVAAAMRVSVGTASATLSAARSALRGLLTDDDQKETSV